jgi:hypothetical protein
LTQISLCPSGQPGGAEALCVLTVQSGLDEPDADWKKPDQEKWASVIVERRWLARLCQNEALGNKVQKIKQTKHSKKMEKQYK